MNLNKLAVLISAIEGGKVNLKIAQIKEVLAIVSDLTYENTEVTVLLYNSGKKRFLKKSKKK